MVLTLHPEYVRLSQRARIAHTHLSLHALTALLIDPDLIWRSPQHFTRQGLHLSKSMEYSPITHAPDGTTIFRIEFRTSSIPSQLRSPRSKNPVLPSTSPQTKRPKP